MSLQRRTASQGPSLPAGPSVSQSPADLESTAELPTLEIAAYEARVSEDHLSSTDTWAVPALAAAAPPAVNEVAAHELRSRLEDDLKSLSTNLRDVEERLASKGERLNALENEFGGVRAAQLAAERRAEGLAQQLESANGALASARGEISALAERIAGQDTAARAAQSRNTEQVSTLAARDRALEQALTRVRELESTAAAHLEALHTHEGRRGIFEQLLRGLDGEVGSGDARCTRLEDELNACVQQVRELTSELGARSARLEAREAEVNSLASALAQRDKALAAAALANEEIQASMRMVTRELKTELGERATRVQALEAEVQSLSGTLAKRHEDLSGVTHASGALKQQVTALEGELELLRALAEERGRSLEQAQAAQAKQAEQRGAADARATQLEAQLADQQLAVGTLHAELRERAERSQVRDAELRTAAETIQRLEAEVRAKLTRIEELTKLTEERRSTVEAACQELADRDALIRRLENEAHNSAALLDNIQHRIGSLEPPTLGADPAPEGATRLLIRAEGEGEVVHVLARKTTVGRTPDNDLQIDTKFISRHHAVILAGPVHTIIEDLDSTNGVLVNGRRITRQTLKDGDAVVIGKTQFRFATRAASERR